MKSKALICAALLAAQSLVAAPDTTEGYVAHEWGTFTSVQGADGVQMEWNPANVLDLPKFVYGLTRPGGLFRPGIPLLTKAAFQVRQRMETPVIYFYADSPQSVDVAVDFPSGTITEWFPQALFADPKTGETDPRRLPARPNAMRWKGVKILPPGSSDPLPTGAATEARSHYFAARDTDANLLRVTGSNDVLETEKFLFYRGVAGFQAPLTVRTSGDRSEVLVLENTGAEELRHLFVYGLRQQRGAYVLVDRLAPGESRTLRLDLEANGRSFGELSHGLGREIQQALVAEGLYEREAEAMVKTWDASWFSEPGVRVLYTLPAAWTDRTLPLRLNPAPRQTARVMVGRAEIITPGMERALEANVDRFIAADEAGRAEVIKNTRDLALGRFAEATLRRVIIGGKKSPEFSAKSWELLQATQ